MKYGTPQQDFVYNFKSLESGLSANDYDSKLNIGAFNDIRPDFINHDIARFNDGIDVVFDLTKIPYPFKDNTFDFVMARFVFEHMPRKFLSQMLDELGRICKPDALIEITVPYGSEWVRSIDHTGGFTDFTFLGLCENMEWMCKQKFDFYSLRLKPQGLGKLIPNFPVTKVYRRGKYYYTKGFRDRVAEYFNNLIRRMIVVIKVKK